MALIDTSIWIEALNPHGPTVIQEQVAELVESQRAATCEVVVVELLRGARDDVEAQRWAARLDGLIVLPLDGVGLVAARIGRRMRAHGSSPPLGDLIVAGAALKHGATILHCDRHLHEIAGVVGIEDQLLEPEPPGAGG